MCLNVCVCVCFLERENTYYNDITSYQCFCVPLIDVFFFANHLLGNDSLIYVFLCFQICVFNYSDCILKIDLPQKGDCNNRGLTFEENRSNFFLSRKCQIDKT